MMRRLSSLLLFALLLGLAAGAQARQIVDMAGRTVEVPDRITKVFAGSPSALYQLYALDPDFIAGLNYPFHDIEKRFLRRDIIDLPVLGGWFGQGHTPNLENVLMAKPDIMLVWHWQDAATNELMERTAKTINLPVVYVKGDTVEEYAAGFIFLGNLLGLEERGATLCAYTRKAMREIDEAVGDIPHDKRVRVYYSEGIDGLRSECLGSKHAALIPLTGGVNINDCTLDNAMGMVKVSLEQVMLGDPQVMLVYSPDFYHRVFTEPQWAQVRAVRDKRVYLIPRSPFNWFDRPPSFMRILCMQWLVNKFYPDRYSKDIPAETRAFYKLFLNVELTDAEIGEVLAQ